MFRVVPDQLRISDGWVRCGQCDEVFDANAHLRNLEEVVQSAQEAAAQTPPPSDPNPPAPFDPDPDPLADASPVPAPAPETEPETDGALAVEEDPPAYDWGLDLPPSDVPMPDIDISLPIEPASAQPALDAAAEQLYESAAAVEPAPEEVRSEPIEPFLDETPAGLPEADDSAPVQSVSESIDHWMHAKQAAELGPAATSTPTPLAAHPEDAPLSFMPKSSQPSRASRWLNARVLAAVSAVMALALTGQFVMYQRDRLAASYPVLRAPLTSVCALAGCTIAAPRQIESIAIESSAFTNVRPGVYLLQVTLKNSASLDLAVPALELTLSDLQDRPLFRKVIQADEIKAKVLTFAAGSELNASVPIHVRDGAASSVTGYKLLAFYP